MGRGDLARPRHGLGRLPELPHPARRSELEQPHQLASRGEPRRHGRRDSDLQQLGRERVQQESLYDSYFKHGIPITASSGDAGYGVEWPASSPYVTSVGGTSLVRANGARGWAET